MDVTIAGRPAGAAERRLWERAKAAAALAYAPYSGLRVGAALATVAGATFSGVNVENAAYPVGLCAERAALAAAVSAGERRFCGARRRHRIGRADPALRRLSAGAGGVRRDRGRRAGSGSRVGGPRRAAGELAELRVVALGELLRAPFRGPSAVP